MLTIYHLNAKLALIVHHSSFLTKNIETFFEQLSQQSCGTLIAHFPNQKALTKAWQQILNNASFIEAAGGVVIYQNKILMIYRKGWWDLPKGKKEEKETPLQCAQREIQEEVGINPLNPINLNPYITYHVYQQNQKRILKKTYWFLFSTDNSEIVLQKEEAIEKGLWCDFEEAKRLQPQFRLIQNVLSYFQRYL